MFNSYVSWAEGNYEHPQKKNPTFIWCSAIFPVVSQAIGGITLNQHEAANSSELNRRKTWDLLIVSGLHHMRNRYLMYSYILYNILGIDGVSI